MHFRNAEEGGKLDRGDALAPEGQHRLKSRMARPDVDVAHAEMIDQNPHATRSQHPRGLRPLRVVRVDLREPSQRLEPLEKPRRIGPPQCVGVIAREVEPHADDTGRGQILERSIRRIRVDHGNHFEPTGIRLHRIEVGRVVGAVSAQLHQHSVADAMLVENRYERLARSAFVRARLVAPLAGERKSHRVDDVCMTVDGASVTGHESVVRHAIAVVVAGSKRWSAVVSTASSNGSPRRKAVSRPMRAVSSAFEPSSDTISSVSAPNASTASTRAVRRANRPGSPGADSYRSSGRTPTITSPETWRPDAGTALIGKVRPPPASCATLRPSFSAIRAGSRFIGGLPRKRATNVFAGFR